MTTTNPLENPGSQDTVRPPIGKKPAQRKTVTFGDGSEVTGSVPWSVISLVGLMVVWFIVKVGGDSAMVNDRTFPTQGQVIKAVYDGFTEGYRNVNLANNTWTSLWRVIQGMFFAIIIGVPVGFAMGLSNTLRGIFDPPVELFRPIPPLALLPLFIVWFGIGELGKVMLLFFAALWIIIIGSRAGVLGVSKSKVHAAYSLGASKLQILRHVILPNALPEIFTSIRVALGVCWGTLVAAEITGAEVGLGAMIFAAKNFFRMDVVVAGIIIIGVLGVAMDFFMRFLERKLIPWRGKG